MVLNLSCVLRPRNFQTFDEDFSPENQNNEFASLLGIGIANIGIFSILWVAPQDKHFCKTLPWKKVSQLPMNRIIMEKTDSQAPPPDWFQRLRTYTVSILGQSDAEYNLEAY